MKGKETVDSTPVSKLGSKIKQAQIDMLKKRLRAAYLQWDRECDSMSCGHSLAAHVNPRVGHLVVKMPRLAARLRELGEACPPVPGEADFK